MKQTCEHCEQEIRPSTWIFDFAEDFYGGSLAELPTNKATEFLTAAIIDYLDRFGPEVKE